MTAPPADLRRIHAEEPAQLQREAAALRRLADSHEAAAKRFLDGGDKATHNAMMTRVHGMRERALLAERYLSAKLGARSSRAHAVAASAPRKLWPHDIKKMQAEYARRVAAGELHGAVSALAAEFEVSTKTVSRYVKPKAKGK